MAKRINSFDRSAGIIHSDHLPFDLPMFSLIGACTLGSALAVMGVAKFVIWAITSYQALM